MAAPQHLRSTPIGEAQTEQENNHRANFLRNGHAAKPKSSHRFAQQRLRKEKASKIEQQATIALICGWVVEHQLGTCFDFRRPEIQES